MYTTPEFIKCTGELVRTKRVFREWSWSNKSVNSFKNISTRCSSSVGFVNHQIDFYHHSIRNYFVHLFRFLLHMSWNSFIVLILPIVSKGEIKTFVSLYFGWFIFSALFTCNTSRKKKKIYQTYIRMQIFSSIYKIRSCLTAIVFSWHGNNCLVLSGFYYFIFVQRAELIYSFILNFFFEVQYYS